MAGAGYKLFQTGDVLTAAQVNTYLNEQTVMVFANAAARTSALTSVLAEGMVSYLQDTNAVEVYNGSAWVGVSGAGDVTEVQAGTGISVASGTGPIPVVTNTMATAVDAKGDLIVGTGADTFARLAVGTNGHTLVAKSSEATGLAWEAPAAGAFTQLATGSLTGSSVSLTSISASYKSLVLWVFSASATSNGSIKLQFNSDTAGNYYSTQTFSSSSSVDAQSGATLIQATTGQDLNTSTINTFKIELFGYASASAYKTHLGSFIGNRNTVGLQGGLIAGGYASTTAISSIQISPENGTWDSGTYFLYGVN